MASLPVVHLACRDTALARVLDVRLRHLGLKVTKCSDAMQLLIATHKRPPELIIAETRLPAGSGLAVCEMIRSDKRLSQIPVVMLRDSSDREAAARCEKLGVFHIDKSQDHWSQLKALLVKLLPERVVLHETWSEKSPETVERVQRLDRQHDHATKETSRRPKVLLIDKDSHVASTIRLRFLAHGFDVIHSATGKGGIGMAVQECPDAIILDIDLPDIDGLQVLCVLKSIRSTQDIPVVILTGQHITSRHQHSLMQSGVHKLFSKPFDADALVLCIAKVAAPVASKIPVAY